MEPGHHGAHRDVENLGGVGVAEVADVDEHDDVAEVVGDVGEGVHDRVLREALDDAVLVEELLAPGFDHLVGEVVVVLLERSLVGPALETAPAVDVEVREDPEEPRPEIRARGIGLPAPKGPCICVLDKILCFLAGRYETSGHSVDLIRERAGLFLEPHPIAGFARAPARPVWLGRVRLTHRATVAAYGSMNGPPVVPIPAVFRRARARGSPSSREPRRAPPGWSRRRPT